MDDRWAIEYDNAGNGGFSEGWDLKLDGHTVGRIDHEKVAQRLVGLLNIIDGKIREFFIAEALRLGK